MRILNLKQIVFTEPWNQIKNLWFKKIMKWQLKKKKKKTPGL